MIARETTDLDRRPLDKARLGDRDDEFAYRTRIYGAIVMCFLLKQGIQCRGGARARRRRRSTRGGLPTIMRITHPATSKLAFLAGNSLVRKRRARRGLAQLAIVDERHREEQRPAEAAEPAQAVAAERAGL